MEVRNASSETMKPEPFSSTVSRTNAVFGCSPTNTNAAAGDENVPISPVARSRATNAANLPFEPRRNSTTSVFVWIANFWFARARS
jgi:hypothetical protein